MLEVEREVGRGAYGVVYLARDTLLNRPVALKVLTSKEGAIPAEKRQEMLAESRLIGNLKSPHILTLYRLHEDPVRGLLQELEFVDGGTLADELTEERALPVEQAVNITRAVAEALRTAHASRVVHGDIKPANVLFGGDGTVKLADFGLARMLEGASSGHDLQGMAVGSPLYMAPEVITGRVAGMPSDVWSLAVVFYQSLAGRMPFPAKKFRELAMKILDQEPDPLPADTPAPATELLSRCFTKTPKDRPDIEQVLAELEEMAAAFGGRAVVEEVREKLTNLPPPLTTFVGRTLELERLIVAVHTGTTDVLTVTGPGGIGKTRLAQELCRHCADYFEGGAWFADLSEVEDADGIANGVARALGLQPAGQEEPVDFVAGVLEYRDPMLLVLDNFEQLIPHAEGTLKVWLERAPHVRFVVTSRSLLKLDDETQIELSAMPVPARGETSRAAIEDCDGVRLFLERAREANPTFDLTDTNAKDVAQIVRELEGIPLAVELAAARSRIMQPRKIAENLGRKFQLLRSSRRDVSDRQRTLEGAIEWSFDLLSEVERDAYLQASWFSDGFSLPAAEKVLRLSDHADAPPVMDVLQSLIYTHLELA